MSIVTRHMSLVTHQMPHVECHMSQVLPYKYLKKVLTMCLTRHKLLVTCIMSILTRHMSHAFVTCHRSHVTSYVTRQTLQVLCMFNFKRILLEWKTMCHTSHVICYKSHVTCKYYMSNMLNIVCLVFQCRMLLCLCMCLFPLSCKLTFFVVNFGSSKLLWH